MRTSPCRLAAAAASALALTLAFTLGTRAHAQDAMPPAVQAALDKAQVPASALAAMVLPLSGSTGRWQHQADRPMPPASTMKLVTSVVALHRLGPNLRGRTELLSNAPVEGGVLRGDLVLRGGADPELGLAQVWQLLWELRHQGITHIEGGLVIDRTLFRPARIDTGLPPFDDAPEFPYNVIPDALLFTGNLMTVDLASDERGVSARSVPALEGVEFDTRAMVLSDSACADWDEDWKFPTLESAGPTVRITLQGAFPKTCSTRAELQLLDRTLLTERTVRTLWAGLGGSGLNSGLGSVREDTAPPGARVLATHQSRPWGEVLRSMNKQSDNALTRLLFLQLGLRGMAAEPGTPTLVLAQRDVHHWFAEHQINPNGLVLDNGSGLSRSERITPRQMVLMLKAAASSRYAPDLLMSLPVAGVDGTLRNRLKAGPATGWARLKTGTLANVTALAGVVPDQHGRPWLLAAMVEHEHAAKARPALDALVEWVARSGAVPGNRPLKPPPASARPPPRP